MTAALAVAMILRRLDHADLRIGERRDQILQPVRPHHVIGIDDADDLGICRRVREREPQRARFVSGDIVLIDELETFAERAAMILDRAPKRRVGRVVDDDDAFEVRIIEPGDRIESRLEHVRRLTMGRNMDRNLRCETVGRGQGRRDQTARPASEGDRRDLFDARERDRNQRYEQDDTEHERESGAEHEIVGLPEGKDCREPGADDVGRDRKRDSLTEPDAAARQDRKRQQQAKQNGETSELPMVRIVHQPDPG